MKKYQLFLLSILSGVLLSVAWPASGFPLILFIGFVPFLIIEDFILSNKKSFTRLSVLLYTYPGMLTWNLLTTWWVYNSTVVGSILAFVINSLFMAIVLNVFHLIRRRISNNNSIWIFPFIWISFEFLHLNWDLTWTWLSLGNGFASYYKWIQWYEYTGVFGGTLWILTVNVSLFLILKNFVFQKNERKKLLKYALIVFAIILIPIVFSIYKYKTYTEKINPKNFLVVQPNIDPYNEKFSSMPSKEQMDKMLNLARQKATKQTDFVIFPETAIPEGIWEDELEISPSIKQVRDFVKDYSNSTVVIGLSSHRMFKKGEPLSSTARKYNKKNPKSPYYDIFNTALQVDSSKQIHLYHKSKLVPGVEKMPFPKLLKPLEKYAIELGGSSGSFGTQKERTPFTSLNKTKIAPVICYESVYGEFVSEFIQNGAQFIVIITNDGWWGDTPGYRQHFNYARLRAIETRRSIARSANTGISTFINQRGDDFESTKWWEPKAITASLNANDEITFYVKYGDYIGRIAYYFSIFLIFFAITSWIIKKFKKN
ncbi:MAG: apolipoprotein N-acyltransferase [Bacteroidetes bacterium]|nr:apolipoprotein N-acyltransferase [Bacteroidota bacterium]